MVRLLALTGRILLGRDDLRNTDGDLRMSAIFAEASSMWHEMKTEFDAALVAAYNKAETETNGFMVNLKGKAKALDGWDLFVGPEIRARVYASEELIEHWNKNPRPNLNRFEAQWIEGRVAWNR